MREPLSHPGDFNFCQHVINIIVSKPLQSELSHSLDVESAAPLGRDLTRVRHAAHRPWFRALAIWLQSAFEVSLGL